MNKNLPAILGGEPVFKKGLPPYNTIGEEEKKAVMRVMDSGVLGSFVARKGEYFLGGKEVLSFEKKFSRMFDVPYAISNNSATAALHMAVAALDVGPGDEVIVSPFTMSATASAILIALDISASTSARKPSVSVISQTFGYFEIRGCTMWSLIMSRGCGYFLK